MGIDPVSMAMSASQIGIGSLQALIGGFKARKTQKQLENMATPTYKQNQSVLDYYNQALTRYQTAPENSAFYKTQMQNAGRATATGLSALQGRRSALAGVGNLVQQQNDASLRAGIAAEQQNNQRFGQLQGATSMRAGEDRAAFQQNVIAPFEKNYNLLALKSGAANQTVNSGLKNIFGGFQSAAQMALMGGDNPYNPQATASAGVPFDSSRSSMQSLYGSIRRNPIQS